MNTQHPPKPALWQSIVVILFVLLFIGFSYTFLHEGGHALFGLLFGGTLTSFNVDFITFTAHVGMDGEFTQVQRAIISVAGVGLPILLWTLFLISRVKPPCDNPVLDWLMLVGTAGVYSTLIAWIIIPILTLSGQSIGDDSATFISITGLSPLLVSALALLVLLGGYALYLSRAGGLRAVRERFKASGSRSILNAPAAATLRGLSVLLVALIGGTLALGMLSRSGQAGQVPVGYTLVYQSQLSQEALVSAPVYHFRLEQPAEVRFFFVLKDLQHPPLDISLLANGDYKYNFLHFESDPGIGRATIRPDPLSLAAGDYELRITAPRGQGEISAYIRQGE